MSGEPLVELIEVAEHDDGSATITLEVDFETLKRFAGLYMRQVLVEAAERVLVSEPPEDITTG